MDAEARAARFDARVAPPEEARPAIVRALGEMAGIGPDQRWLELGPGTGALSVGLLGQGVRYTGVDRSTQMLDVFRRRIGEDTESCTLVHGDGNDRWPPDDGSVDVVFCSRAIHHIKTEHAVSETLRVASAGGARFIVGRVRRPRESVKSTMRAAMRELLRTRGLEGLDHDRTAGAILEALEAEGWRPVTASVAGRWSRLRTPAESLLDWEKGDGLAGLPLPPGEKASILEELRVWASGHYGGLDRPMRQDEWYELAGAESRVVG